MIMATPAKLFGRQRLGGKLRLLEWGGHVMQLWTGKASVLNLRNEPFPGAGPLVGRPVPRFRLRLRGEDREVI
jgi:hypothetical protein